MKRHSWLHKCLVCKKGTDKCPPSPFLPYSGWRCKECVAAKRVPYQDLLVCYLSRDKYNAMGPGLYFDKYMIPTLEFFGKTLEELDKESKENNDFSWGEPAPPNEDTMTS